MTAYSILLGGVSSGPTLTPSTGTLTIANGKTLTVSNSLTLTATDGSTLAIGTGGTLGTAAFKATGTSGNMVPLLDGANTWSGTQIFSSGVEVLGGGHQTAAPTAGALYAPFVATGTSNTAGVNLQLVGGVSTGTGAGGALQFYTTPAGSSGSAQNTLVVAGMISGAGRWVLGSGADNGTDKLQVTGTSNFSSIVTLGNGTKAAPTLVFTGSNTEGFYWRTSGYMMVALGGKEAYQFGAGGFAVPQSISLGPANNDFSTTAPDTVLLRVSADVLAMQNGGNAQEFRVTGTTTGSKYLKLKHDGTDAIIDASSGVIKLGVTATTLQFGTFTSIGAETLSGYITIKDAAGNTRKVGVIA